MANRRCLQALTRQASAFIWTNPPLQSLLTHSPPLPNSPVTSLTYILLNNFADSKPAKCSQWSPLRYFSSSKEIDNTNEGKEIEGDEDDDEYEEEEDDDEYEEEEDWVSGDDEEVSMSSGKREYTPEEKEAEAAAIGYKVIGPLDKKDRVFKPYERVFAVVQIGSHQFKVSNGDCIFTERLKFCEVNDKLILNNVLLLGTSSQTTVGRPMVPDAAVHAVVEEHALDAKVIIFKKKRRKNYRRTKGHRQELTKLRITDIQGIEKPINTVVDKPPKEAKKKQEKVAVPA